MRRARFVIVAGIVGAILVGSVPAQAGVVRLETMLSGGGSGDPDGTGTALLWVNRKRSKICYSLAVADIALPATMAHIHWEDDPTPPDVVAFLAVPVDMGGGAAGISACIRNVKRTLITGLRRHPEQYYVNIHNDGYPGGAISGALSRV